MINASVKLGLTNERLSQMLDRAARAAAITVSRSGALPPGRDEI